MSDNVKPDAEAYVDVTDPLAHLPQPKRSAAMKVREFVKALRKMKPPSKYGDLFVGQINDRLQCRITMHAREGLYEAKVIEIVIPVAQWSDEYAAKRLAEAWGRMHESLFLASCFPGLYVAEGSSIEVVKSPTVNSMDLM